MSRGRSRGGGGEREEQADSLGDPDVGLDLMILRS